MESRMRLVEANRKREMRPYNGFTSAEREAAGRVIAKAIAAGKVSKPRRCSICCVWDAATRRIQCHLEDYRKPLEFYPVCGSCHYCLHRRFSDPSAWHYLVENSEAQWCKGLTMNPHSRLRPFDETYPSGIATG